MIEIIGKTARSLYRTGTNYTIVHDSNSAEASFYTMLHCGQRYADPQDPDYYYVWRSGLVFDTSVLGEGYVITRCKLRLYCDYACEGTDFDIVIVRGTDLDDPPNLLDYGELLDETISRGSINSAGVVPEQFVEITLNEVGLSEINVTGLTKFGLRSSRDINSQAPLANDEMRRFYPAEVGADPYKPTLVFEIGLGYIWCSNQAGEETELHYIDAAGAERAIEGTTTGQTGIAGHLWVEGTYLHYIDSAGAERRQEGTAEGATGKIAGHLWIEATKLRYIDASGNERYIEGVLV